jgi:NitT/TauT family transport system substrate-binding protein
MKQRQLVSLAALAAVVALAATGCSSPTSGGDSSGAASEELRTVNLGTVPLALFAPLFVAEAKGYFADEGIELNTQTVTSGQDAIPLTANGQLDVLIAGFSAGMLNAASAGLDVQVVGSMNIGDGSLDDPPAALVASTAVADPITDIADLKGRKVAIAGGLGGSGAYFTGEILAREGLTLNDIVVENLGNSDMPAALASGAVDAALTSAPFNSNAVDDGSAVTIAVPGEGTAGTGVIYGGEFAESDLAQPFFSALARGAQDLQDGAVYDDDNLEIVAKATDQDVELLRETPLFVWLPDLAPQPAQIELMEEIWGEAGALTFDEPLDLSTFVNTTFADNVD